MQSLIITSDSQKSLYRSHGIKFNACVGADAIDEIYNIVESFLPDIRFETIIKEYYQEKYEDKKLIIQRFRPLLLQIKSYRQLWLENKDNAEKQKKIDQHIAVLCQKLPIIHKTVWEFFHLFTINSDLKNIPFPSTERDTSQRRPLHYNE